MTAVPRLLELLRASRFAEALPVWESLGDARFKQAALLEVGAALHDQLGRRAEAARLWGGLHRQRPHDPEIVVAWAEALAACGKGERAVDVLATFAGAEHGLHPELERYTGQLLAQRAAQREERRETSAARGDAEAALVLDPTVALAQRVLIRLDHQDGAFDAAIARARALLERELPDAERASLWLELAVLERRAGRVDEAWAAAERGNRLQREVQRKAGLDPEAWPRLVARIRPWRGSRPVPPADGPQPVWMVGFPRSGTTLLQQILQAHPRVQTLDEVDLAMTVLREHLPPGAAYPDCLDGLGDADWDALRAAYRAKVAALGLPEHDVLVDKLPLNIVRLDFLVRLFPGSRVLVNLRDPRDCVLSNFFQDYAANAAMAPFADLGDTARAYADAMGLWLDRRDGLPVPWRELRYEDLAADTEPVARGLLEWLGVAWDPAVLAHHEAAAQRPISTPSRYDVSKPVYRTAVGRWRGFEAKLAPVLPLLEPFADAFGYER